MLLLLRSEEFGRVSVIVCLRGRWREDRRVFWGLIEGVGTSVLGRVIQESLLARFEGARGFNDVFFDIGEGREFLIFSKQDILIPEL